MEVCTLGRGILFHVPYFQHCALLQSGRWPREINRRLDFLEIPVF
jgi:hypothetical protein